MHMESIFDPNHYAELRRRIESLQPTAERLWGTMQPAQMLAHVNVPLEAGLGTLQLKSEGNFLTRPLLRWFVLSKKPFRRNLPTSPQFVVSDAREFEREKKRLLDNLEEALRRGLAGPWHRHNMFGNLPPEQWGTLTWKHLDHHLRQFGA
jgi:hypothetical protein